MQVKRGEEAQSSPAFSELKGSLKLPLWSFWPLEVLWSRLSGGLVFTFLHTAVGVVQALCLHPGDLSYFLPASSFRWFWTSSRHVC